MLDEIALVVALLRIRKMHKMSCRCVKSLHCLSKTAVEQSDWSEEHRNVLVIYHYSCRSLRSALLRAVTPVTHPVALNFRVEAEFD